MIVYFAMNCFASGDQPEAGERLNGRFPLTKSIVSGAVNAHAGAKGRVG